MLHEAVVTGAVRDSDEGQKMGGNVVQVHCDYISADKPLKRKFPSSSTLVEVKDWARGEFVPNPPSDKAYYLSDDKTRHRFTPDEEKQTLQASGYDHEAKLRLNEEQVAGTEPMDAKRP